MQIQRELEKVERLKREREGLALAATHYTTHLQRARGLRPWVLFVELMRRERERAGQFHHHWRSVQLYHCLLMRVCVSLTF